VNRAGRNLPRKLPTLSGIGTTTLLAISFVFAFNSEAIILFCSLVELAYLFFSSG
jgi:hypothetical protein